MVNGKKVRKRATTGWDIEVEWRDSATSWLPLKEIKETNSVELARYGKDNHLLDEPVFAWWVPHNLKKQDRLIKSAVSRHKRKGYKFGIRIPTTVEEALELDEASENTFREDAIMKERKGVRIAFDIQDTKSKIPPGHSYVDLMMIFDIELDFTRKVRLVARGSLVEPPVTLTYSSVVSRKRKRKRERVCVCVRITFLIAALNDLDTVMFDIGNAYLNTKTTEKLYTYAGPEFGDDAGKLCVIVRALYGLKSSGAAYRNHFAETLLEMGFESCYADADVWRRPALKKDGSKYYEYILTYVDDCLLVSEDANKIIKMLKEEPYNYLLKDVGSPAKYLGAKCGKYNLGDSEAWYMSAELYLHHAIKEVERRWGNITKIAARQDLNVPAPQKIFQNWIPPIF